MKTQFNLYQIKLKFLTEYTITRAHAKGASLIDAKAIAEDAVSAWKVIEKEMSK